MHWAEIAPPVNPNKQHPYAHLQLDHQCVVTDCLSGCIQSTPAESRAQMECCLISQKQCACIAACFHNLSMQCNPISMSSMGQPPSC